MTTRLLTSLEQCSKRFDLALKPGATNFELVAFGLDILEFGFERTHLVNAFLSITTSSHCVGFSLLDFGDLWSKWASF
jgi:hypothetical protein